ncbi:MAG: IS30 family transposase, partial [Clostridia bacterium]
SICTKTLYNYIDMDLFVGISNKDLPYKRRKGKGAHKQIRKVSLNNQRGRSIEERAPKVLTREEEGHWEMDCVVGKLGTSTCLLVLTERAERAEIIRKMDGKTQENVAKELDKLEQKFGTNFRQIFRTITTDNGSEFINSQLLEKSIVEGAQSWTTLYYAHPYSSWERGSNENQNRIIRRFIPKGEDIGKYSSEEIECMEHWINNYPRRQFGYESAAQRCTLMNLR